MLIVWGSFAIGTYEWLRAYRKYHGLTRSGKSEVSLPRITLNGLCWSKRARPCWHTAVYPSVQVYLLDVTHQHSGAASFCRRIVETSIADYTLQIGAIVEPFLPLGFL
jgi:hypothetical protein